MLFNISSAITNLLYSLLVLGDKSADYYYWYKSNVRDYNENSGYDTLLDVFVFGIRINGTKSIFISFFLNYFLVFVNLWNSKWGGYLNGF